MAGAKEPPNNTHWVESLFPPAFGVTLAEVLDGRMPDDEEEDKPRRVHRVSAYNPESIQNVYERVRLTMAAGEEIKRQKEQEKILPKPGPKSTPKTAEETDKLERSVNLSNSGIWDTEEISVLRTVFKSAKGEITQLKVRLHETEDRNEKLEKRAATLEAQLQSKSLQHTDAKKANRRLKIHCDTLQEEVGKSTAKIKTLHEMLDEVKQERSRYMMELHEARLGLDKERLEKKALRLECDGQSRKFAIEKVLAEESVRVSYEQEVADLQKRLELLTTDLEQERNQHAVTKKGLEQLQKHFSSLPYLPGGLPNAVNRDEIKRFQY